LIESGKGLFEMRHLSHCMSRFSLLVVIAFALLGRGSALAEDAVLLASTVPGYTPGMVVASTDRLSVPDGASATLLFRSGGMLRLRGPFEGTLEEQRSGAGETSLAMLADMFRMRGVDATVIGGTRSTGSGRAGTIVDDVEVDPQHSGTYCVDPTTTVWIRRPAGDTGTFALRRRGSNRTIGWPAGATRAEWPADVPIDEGSQFEIVTDGAAHATATFRNISSPSATGPAIIAAGILLGCHDQFDKELRRFSRLATGPELWINTDHGRRPTYRSGEPIALTVTADMDGFLYCITMRDGGGAAPIFPAGAVDGAQLHASAPLAIPGRRQANGLIATHGVAIIRCWLADRDITPELPHALVGVSAGTLPDQIAGELDELFTHVGGTRIATDTLTVKTE
jgi:Domain of unknown function (DUF4384)